jgi:ATP-dependent Clp protease ATP-binding subunit ClpB
MDYKRLESPSVEALAVAQSMAVRRGHPEVGPEHLLLALVRRIRPDAEPEGLSAALESVLERARPEYSRTTTLSTELEAVLESAGREAEGCGSRAITPDHLLASLVECGSAAGELLRARGLCAAGLVVLPSASDGASGGSSGPDACRIRDLTEEGSKTGVRPILGREEVTARLVDVLVEQRHDPLLLGEEGVGKGAVVEALAHALTGAHAPRNLVGARLFAVGSRPPEGGIEELCRRWEGRTSRVLLHIEDARVLADTARWLRTSSVRALVTIIGQATLEEYYGSLSRQPYLEGSLETVLVEPLPPATTVLVLRALREQFETRHEVVVTDDAIDVAVDFARRRLPGTKLPGGAIRVLDEAATRARKRAARKPRELERTEARVFELQSQRARSPRTEEELAELRTAAGWLRARWEQEREAHDRVHSLKMQLSDRGGDELLRSRLRDAKRALPDPSARLIDRDVTRDDVNPVVEKRSDAGLQALVLESRSELVALERRLASDVLGQRAAARLVASALARGSSRLDGENPRGPGGSFLFVGPPGVGKAEMARSLARHVLHDENAFNLVSSDDASRILDAVARLPRVVVLVRDIHQASRDVESLLTHVLEGGAAVDGQGRRVDFREALVVVSAREQTVGWLSPLVDRVVDFSCLKGDIARLIVDRHCRNLSKRLSERRIELEWSPAAGEWLSAHGFPREEGAHRLHRLLADEVGACLGRMLVLGELCEGRRARVDVHGDRLEVSCRSRGPARERSPVDCTV